MRIERKEFRADYVSAQGDVSPVQAGAQVGQGGAGMNELCSCKVCRFGRLLDEIHLENEFIPAEVVAALNANDVARALRVAREYRDTLSKSAGSGDAPWWVVIEHVESAMRAAILVMMLRRFELRPYKGCARENKALG